MRIRTSPALLALVLLCAGAPANAQWQEVKTKHFIIYADEPADKLRAYAQRLERFDHAVRTVRKMGDPELTDSNRVTIFVLPNEASIARLCNCGNVVGFYITRASGSVAFVPSKAGSKFDKYDVDADAVFFHEYAHHLQMQGADVAMPSWVREGFAEFFARTELREDGSVVIGVPPAYRGYSLLENNALGIRDMLGAETSFYSYAEYEGIYARGWSLIHYLTFNPERRGQLDRYIAAIQQGVPALNAAEQAFGDLGELSGALKSYVRQKKLNHLVLTGLQPPTSSITVRPLSAAESQVIRVVIRSKRGAKKSTAPDIAADARKIAANYPHDAFVQTALAQAEFDAKNYAAADAAADRALTANPKSLSALVTKGKAQMELARQEGRGNWGGIRKWFLSANKLDPEAAEPLMFFYKTYLYSGEQPTKNAVDGLLYSIALAPQDSEVRLMAVRQLLLNGDLAQAKRIFAPFAFSPHSKNSWRASAAKAVLAIDKAQAGEAVKHVENLQRLLEEDRD